MKTIFKILAAPIFWLLQACSPIGSEIDPEKSKSHYYGKSKSEIVYSRGGNWFGIGYRKMKADVKSFEVLNGTMSKDKNELFFESFPVERGSLNLDAFYIKKGDYMTRVGFDDKNVYTFSKDYKNKGYHVKATIIADADPRTFERTDLDWGNDEKNHFFKNTKVVADYESFKLLNDYFAKDKYRVFSQNGDTFEPIAALTASFKIIGESSHGIDELQVYWKPFFKNKSLGLITIPYTNEGDVEVINHYFLRIANTIYFDGIARSDIDSNSFAIIDHSYAKDIEHVFYKGDIVMGADPNSFKKMENSYKYIDKNGVYHEGKLEEKETETPK